MCVDKLKVNLLVTPEEAMELAKMRTIEDMHICKDVEKVFSQTKKSGDKIWEHFSLLATIWNAGRVQGIREERIKNIIRKDLL